MPMFIRLKSKHDFSINVVVRLISKVMCLHVSSNQTPSSLPERCERWVSGALKPDSVGLVGLISHYGIPK